MNAVVPIYVEHWGDNLQFYTNFPLFSTLGMMKLDRDQKKGLYQKLKSCSPRNQLKTKKSPNMIQRSDADHSQIIGGIQSNYWGVYPPRFSALMDE